MVKRFGALLIAIALAVSMAMPAVAVADDGNASEAGVDVAELQEDGAAQDVEPRG